ncbi:type II secretion system protein XpsI [Agrilutibacter solisilvae]|nr:prepilin-type N-terminal cleavage/methylation domain-containing protein [Lysobacter solisilvae]
MTARRPMSHRHAPGPVPRQRGFTLLEVIVAFALLAAALTLLLGTLSGAARQVRYAADSGTAALHAQSLLAQLGVGETLGTGRDNGDFDNGRYRWELDVHPWKDPTQPANTPQDLSAPRIVEVQLLVTWGDARPSQRLLLRSLRMLPPNVDAEL